MKTMIEDKLKRWLQDSSQLRKAEITVGGVALLQRGDDGGWYAMSEAPDLSLALDFYEDDD